MNLKCELKFENLVALQRDSMKMIDKVRKRITTMKVVAILLLVITLFIINPSFQPFDVAINIVLTVIFALFLPIIINKSAVRIVRKSENSMQLGPFDLKLSEEGIEIHRENDSKYVPLEEINRVTSDDENFFLYYGNRSAFIIPKNAVLSQAQLIEFLSAHVGKDKIKSSREAGLNNKKRRVILSLLVAVTVLLFGLNYYSIKPDYEVSSATKAVNDLFMYTDQEDNEGSKIKETTKQVQIDLVINQLEKIDTSKSRYEKYTLLMLGQYFRVNEAQKQLNEREGIQSPNRTNHALIEFATNSDLTPIENLLENIPELQTSFDEVPWDMQGKILLPSFDDIPFDVGKVRISNNDRPSVEVYYGGGGMIFTSSVTYYEGDLSERGEEVQLIGDKLGYYSDDKVTNSTNSIGITWSDQEKDSSFLYSARLLSDHDFTKDDVIKLANAMLANEENMFTNHAEGYISKETDVVLKSESVLENIDILEDFMEVAGTNNESHIRIVKNIPGRGAIIYDLESRYADYADQGWIEVTPVLTYYEPVEDDFYDVFNQAPQQCGELTKDVEEGFYKLYECRTHLEYRLLPIKGF